MTEAYDIFISYEYENKDIVLKLYENLTQTFGLKVWMDLKCIRIGDNLSERILNALKSSKILVSCMTKSYSLTTNCQKEFLVADSLRKKMVILMFEDNRLSDLGKLGKIMDRFIRINMFKDKESLNINSENCWKGNLSNALYYIIETILGIDLSSKIPNFRNRVSKETNN